MSTFRQELNGIPDLVARARRLAEIDAELTEELRQAKNELAREMADDGLTMREIGDAFGVGRSRAHQMVHGHRSVRKPKASPDTQ